MIQFLVRTLLHSLKDQFNLSQNKTMVPIKLAPQRMVKGSLSFGASSRKFLPSFGATLRKERPKFGDTFYPTRNGKPYIGASLIGTIFGDRVPIFSKS